MRGLLIALCALATVAGVLAGGCAFLVSGLGLAVAPNQAAAADLLLTTVPVLAVTGVVVLANVALIAALAGGEAPRRNRWFLLLAIVDFAYAAYLVVTRIAWRGPWPPATIEAFVLPAALTLKGVLTLMLPAEPPPLPPGSRQETSSS
jgi:hypothetical protein